MSSENALIVTLSDQPQQSTVFLRNESSIPEGCKEIRLQEWDYLPWSNPDNLMTLQDRIVVSKARSTIVVILSLIGCPASVINMAVFFKQGLKDRVNLLLFSLSLVDGSFITVATVQYFEEFYLQFAGESTVGPMLVFFFSHNLFGFHGLCFVSFVLSAIIACERCYCVLYPLKYQIILRTRTVAIIIVSVYTLILGLFFIVSFRYYMGCFFDPDLNARLILFFYNDFYRLNKDFIDYLDNIFFGAVLPTTVVFVVMTATIITVTKLRKVVAWRTESASSVSAKEIALTKMLIGTSVFLIVCASPACVFRVMCFLLSDMSTGQRKENFYASIMRISQICVYINSSFNIFIYYNMGSKYRQTFGALFKRKRKAERRETVYIIT